jgi:hypothetical protein
MKSQVYTEEFNSVAHPQYRSEECLLRRIDKNVFLLQTGLKIGDRQFEENVLHIYSESSLLEILRFRVTFQLFKNSRLICFS